MDQKVILVTGANRGLGAAIAKCAKNHGFFVIGTTRNPIKSGSVDIDQLIELDLGNQESISDFCDKISKLDRRIDFLINNAGFNPKDHKDGSDYFRSTFKIEHFNANNVADSLWINALAPMTLVSKLLPCLVEDAVILNISSWLGSIERKTSGGHYGYAGSKALLNMFTRGLALEFAETNRVALALNPGWMRTDMGGGKADHSPEDVAEAILGLFDQGVLKSKNGHFLNIDGTEHPW